MQNEQQIYYQALCSRDDRFDGRFFVGVTSTGVYCRPVCRVRTPKLGHCRFFPSPAAAEAEGFRPCLRCRPELAPGFSAIDSRRLLSRQAAALIDGGAMLSSGIGELAQKMGVSPRHLRRIFAEEIGVSPLEYLRTRRLLTAKILLTDTSLPVIDVAAASGFGSLSQFNAVFRRHYKLTPRQLRRQGSGTPKVDAIGIELPYREPYDWPAMLAYFAKRAIAGVEKVNGDRYRRTVSLRWQDTDLSGWIEVSKRDAGPRLHLAISASLAKVTPRIIHRVRALLDLDADPEPILARLGPLAVNPGLRVPGSIDGFEIAVRAVLGQQVSLAAARTLLGRLVQRTGSALASDDHDLTHCFPRPGRILALSEDTLGRCGITRRRAQSIQALARALDSGELDLDQTSAVHPTLHKLLALPGIGPWTAHYIALRALRWPDAFLASDHGVRKALAPMPATAIKKHSEQWRPWRAYALVQLWLQLETQEGRPHDLVSQD